MHIIGHRGAVMHFPENTLESFEKAIELGCHGIELDVHLSADGVPVVIHDPEIDRTTSGSGKVAEMNVEQLQEFRIGDDFIVPTLQEVFELIDRRCFINVEIKDANAVTGVIELIDKSVLNKYLYSDFIISSFAWEALLEIRNQNPEIRIGVLTSTEIELAVGFASFIKAQAIHPYFHLLNATNTAEMLSSGFKVYPWTVNEETDIAAIKKLGVSGIITDYPERI